MKLDWATACIAALFLAACLFSHTVALRLLLLASGIVLACFVVARERDVRALPSLWIPFVLWGGWAALSLLWSLEPERTVKEWRNEVFYTGAALWICFVGAQARGAARLFFPVVASAATIACMGAFYYFFFQPSQYMFGWHGGPGDHTSALITLMPCVIMAGWYARSARWPWWTPLAVWSIGGLFLASAYTASSRTVWPAFALEFLLLGGLLYLRRRDSLAGSRRRYTAAAGATLTVAAVVGCIAIALSVQAERRPMGFAKSLEQEQRFILWPKVIDRAAERPWTGYGFGRGILRKSFMTGDGTIDTDLWHSHNLVLEALIQTGIPGLLLFVALLAAVLREAWKLARGRDEAAALCGIALAGVVAGMLVRNMTDVLLARQNSLLFWGLVGIVLGLATNATASSVKRDAPVLR